MSELLARMSDTRVTVRTPDVAGLMKVLARRGRDLGGGCCLVVSGLDVGRIAELAVEHRLRPRRAGHAPDLLEDAFLELTQCGRVRNGATGDERGARAEWIKLRTIRSTAWAVLALASVSVPFSVLRVLGVRDHGRPGRPGDNDIVLDSLSGIWFGQVALAVLAILAIIVPTR